MPQTIERKLTTILAADAQGYSARMETDEIATIQALRAARDVFRKFISRHKGRIANTAGDGLLAEFPSVVEAVSCAIEVQRELAGGALPYRIGIHLGDVLIDGEDLLGEGVNLAARLQTMAEPGGILVSQQVFDQVESKLSVGFEYLGERRPKNYTGDVPIYRVSTGSAPKMTDQAQATHREEQAAHSTSATLGAATPSHGEETHDELEARVRRHIKLGGAFWAFLVLVDLATGDALWAHFPGIVILTAIGFEAAPLLRLGDLPTRLKRGLVLLGGLTLINLVTYSGTLWVFWLLLLTGLGLALRRILRRQQ